MINNNMRHYTRFRAYQLSSAGSSMSISVENHFTLIEARYNDDNKKHILWELNLLDKTNIDVLHITSWDEDHCNANELRSILNELKPQLIEYPDYSPHTDSGKRSLMLIKTYCNMTGSSIRPVSPVIVSDDIKCAERLKGKDVLLNPIEVSDSSNDNSVIKFFRRGSFQILSTGDCESGDISERIQNNEIVNCEVDVLVLPHHGSEHSILTPEFLKALNPKVCICTVDYKNKFGHPDKKVVTWIDKDGIPYISTKTGDVIIQTVDNRNFKVSNYVSNNETLESVRKFTNKTYYPNDTY